VPSVGGKTPAGQIARMKVEAAASCAAATGMPPRLGDEVRLSQFRGAAAVPAPSKCLQAARRAARALSRCGGDYSGEFEARWPSRRR
jgi:hypothetical protein